MSHGSTRARGDHSGRERALWGILALAVLAVLSAAMSGVVLMRTLAERGRAVRKHADELTAVQRVASGAELVSRRGRAYVLTGTEAQRAAYRTANEAWRRDLTELMGKVGGAGGDSVILESIRVQAQALEHAQERLIGRRDANVDSMRLAEALEHEVDPLRDALQGRFFDLVEMLGKELRANQAEATRASRFALLALASIIVVAVLLSLALGTSIARQTRAARHASEFEQRLVGIVGHDIRNPLSAIVLNARLLEKRVDEPNLAAVLRIKRSARLIEQIVALLLDFTRARLGGGIPLTPGAVDLAPCIDDALEGARAAAPGRTFELQREGGLTGFWDAARVGQALSNLLQNAVRYGAADEPIVVRARGKEDTVTLEVHNGGKPIDPALLPHLFDPMRRGDPAESPEGLGLGLYIVREIVERHGGRVGVRSTAAAGTTFELVLPRGSGPR